MADPTQWTNDGWVCQGRHPAAVSAVVIFRKAGEGDILKCDLLMRMTRQPASMIASSRSTSQ